MFCLINVSPLTCDMEGSKKITLSMWHSQELFAWSADEMDTPFHNTCTSPSLFIYHTYWNLHDLHLIVVQLSTLKWCLSLYETTCWIPENLKQSRSICLILSFPSSLNRKVKFEALQEENGNLAVLYSKYTSYDYVYSSSSAKRRRRRSAVSL